MAPRVAAPGRPRGARRRRPRRRRPGGRADRRVPIPPTTRCSCCGRHASPRSARSASPARRSTGWPPASTSTRGRSAGRTGRSTSSSPCSARGTGRSTCSSRSTSAASSCACCRSGRPCAAGRSATPTTASPSTGTCGRRPPTPPPSPTASTGPTCSCSGRCSTTSARATPATTPRRGWRSSPRSARGSVSPPGDVDVLVRLVQHHLLLPDVAMRRDLSDPATIRKVADAVGDVADARAAARPHRGRLAGDRAVGVGLVEGAARRRPRRAHARRRSTATRRARRHRGAFPDEATLATMAGRPVRRAATGALGRRTAPSTITVVCADAPGVVRPHRRRAVAARPRRADGVGVLRRARRAGDGRVAVPGRPAARPASSGRGCTRTSAAPSPASWPSRPASPSGPARTAGAGRRRRRRPARRRSRSTTTSRRTSTVIEVRAPNRIGVLHRIAKALAELGLDIRHATVQTLGEDVVDTFYVQARRRAPGRRRVPPRRDRAGRAPRRFADVGWPVADDG